MEPRTTITRSARYAAFIAFFACTSTLTAHAQAPTSFADATSPAASAQPILLSTATPSLDLASIAGVTYSSSADAMVDPVEAERLNLGSLTPSATQPPPRRRYGRPRYRDSSHNADGSNKYAFIVGGGFTLPTGNTLKYLNTSYAFQVGGGRNFNKNLSLIAQFDYDRFGFNGSTLANQSIIYFNATTGQGLDGSSHVWSFSLNPVLNIYSSEGLGAYIVGGVGFYHKVADFTVPTTRQVQDYFGNIYQYTANQIIDHYTSNAPGFNGGFGLTYKPSRFAGERFYVEARYVFIDNQQRPGYTAATISTAPLNATNLYPANSNRTSYIPVKIGVRF